MTKPEKESSQVTIFDYLQEMAKRPTPSGLGLVKEIKLALTDDLRYATDPQGMELSRYQVAARMSDLLGEEITKTTLDNWTAPSHPHEIPVRYLPAFVQATGQRRAFEVLSRHAGLFALPGPDALRVEIQQWDEQIKKLYKKKRNCSLLLRELEGGDHGR
ncbi:MAG: hypothetical protein WC291_00880 [Thermodesulfovibrionales bacterium]|jgi:hypothetical protein